MDTTQRIGTGGFWRFYGREVWQIGWDIIRGVVIIEATVGILIFVAWIVNEALLHIPSQKFGEAGVKWFGAIPWWVFVLLVAAIALQIFLIGNWKAVSKIIEERDRLVVDTSDRLARFRAKKEDIEGQAKYLKNDREGKNVAVTIGQTIMDEIDEELFIDMPFEHKLKTRIHALNTKSYQWQTGSEFSNQSIPYCIFLVYMSVKTQEDDAQYLLNPGTPPPFQRIEWGLRELVKDFDKAISELEGRL